MKYILYLEPYLFYAGKGVFVNKLRGAKYYLTLCEAENIKNSICESVKVLPIDDTIEVQEYE